MLNPFDTPERIAFRTNVQNFVATEVMPYADQWDEIGDIPWELHEKVGALGVWGLGIEEKYGGLGMDDCFMRAIFGEEFGKCGAGGVSAALGGRTISLDPIQRLANDHIRTNLLPEIVAGRIGSSLAITEPGGGSDVANLQTTAVKAGDQYVINGSKTFITGGMKSDYFVVGARTGEPGVGGISLFFVEHDRPGFTRTELERKMGWWASDTATLYFDDLRVPVENLMGAENAGFLAIMENFNLERVNLVAGSLGMMKACFEDAVAWAKERRTFGKPLIKHQVIRHKIADMSAKTDAVECYLNHICAAVNAGHMPVAEVCKAKFFATKALEFVASEAMQIMGGAGYLRGNRIERAYREVKVMAIGGGSEEIMRDLAVRQMGL